MKDYATLTDFEINKAVAENLPYTHVIGDGKYPSISDDAVYVERKAWKYGNTEECGVDYCNNPSDAWPIIVENRIDIALDSDGTTTASHYCYAIGDFLGWYNCENPLKAAMICYLMIKDAEK